MAIPSIPLLLKTLFLWKPEDSRAALILIWIIRIITFSLVFRSFVGPYILRLLSSRLRVQSVSLRSIRGIYFRAGKGVLHVERVGLGYHRPSPASASRFSIRVEAVRIEVTKTEERTGKAAILRRRRGPRLADLAPFPLAVYAWDAARAVGSWIYISVEPFVRPAIRTVMVWLLRTAIRALPALTQVLDLEVDSATITLQSIPGMELVVRKVNVHTSVVFTQLDNSANPTVAQQPRHKRFASVADIGTRLKNSFKRSWGRAWGSTQAAASLSIRVDELLGVASGPLMTELNLGNTSKHTFVVIPSVAFSTSVHLDPRQQIERHGLEAHLASDPASLDIDIVQYILGLLKKQREQLNDDEDEVFTEMPLPDTQTAAEKTPSPSQSPPLSPPVMSPRFGWASPMSPNSPLMEALSVRFRWKKHHPVRRIRGKESTAQFSVLKAASIDLPGLTLIHRLPLTPEYHPETYKVTLARIKFGVALSHPDRVPLHREWLGRTTAPGDPLTPDVYAVKFSVIQTALDRVGSGTVVDHLRVVSLGHSHITVLVSQWPSPWMTGPTFLSGDPNSQFIIADISLGKIEITEHLDVIQKHLSLVKPSRSRKNPDNSSPLPPVVSPVPRIAFGLHTHEISWRVIAVNPTEEGCSPFALEAHTEGFAMFTQSHFQMLPDHRFGKVPTDPDRPRLQMNTELQATLHRTFVNINHAGGDSTTDWSGTLGLSTYPPEPVLSIETVQISGTGHAFGEMTEDSGSVTIDMPSMFFNAHCACDAVSVELWQPDAVAAVRAIIATANSKRNATHRDDSIAAPRYLLDTLPAGISLSLSIGQVMAFVTGPDLAPGEDLNIYRGVAFHTGVSFTYCYLRDKHCEGFPDLLSRRQKRLQLSLNTELLATAAGSSTASTLTQTEQALIKFTMWNLAFRDALSTRFVADDPYGVGDSSEDYRSQEYLRVEEVTADVALSGRRPGGRVIAGSNDECAITVNIKRIRGYLDLAHAYSLLLALQAVKTLSPPRRAKAASTKESTISTTVQCNIDKIQLMWELPLRMKLYSRISSLSVQCPATGIRVNWSSVLLAVPLDVVCDSVPQVEWQELLQLPDWSIFIQPDVLPIAIAIEGDSARLRIPFEYVLADLILDMNVTLKSLKHLTRMVPSGVFSNPSIPSAEHAKSMPNLHLRLSALTVEAADDEFETRLGLIWKAGQEAARLRLERDDAFEAKVATIRAANNEDVSTPSREAQSEFQFTSEHTVSITEARARLFQVHSGAWKSQIRQDHVRQVRRQEDHARNTIGKVPVPDPLDGDLITMKPTPPVPPLLRLTFGDLSLHLTRPSFASNHLADFLYREGAGMPRDTEYSLLIPMHLNFLVSSLGITCREYPLPMFNVPSHSKKDVPGLEFDSDLVIAEEMGTIKTVEWINCAIVKPHTGVHGASPLCITVPKTLNPVKTYANPTIRVKTDDVTDFAWGVSYGPATQDIMRVIDTLSHAPRDSSPPVGFWDKLRLIFHWRIRVLFENEVHLHMKGSHNPEGLGGTGAGFALCWQGNPQLLINQPNDQNELIQVVSDSVMIIMPNLEDTYGETALGVNSAPRSPTSPVTRSNRSRRVCAKFCSGTRFGVGIVLERTCGPDCPHCSGEPFHRQCRFFEFKPHHQVTLELKDHRPIEKTAEDSYNGFRSDFIHLSISLTSSLNQSAIASSSIHLSPDVFAHFWAWWHLFDGRSLPIRQGPRYKHKRPLSPKFGRHLATIKYRIEVPRLFLSHVYTDESRDAWVDGVTPFVGVKAMANHFQADMHQRATESTTIAPDGTHRKVVHKPFDAVEVVMKELDLRALLAVFDTPLKQAVQLEPTNLESTYRKRANMPVAAPDSPWIDLDDFADIGWSSTDTPRVHLLPAVTCPRFTYFKQTTACVTDTKVESSKFGKENSHVCLLGKESSVPQVQIDIALNRVSELRNLSSDGVDSCMPTGSVPQNSADTNYMIALLEDYVAHLRQVDAQSRSLPSNGSQYYMPVDFVSPEEWGDFDNVYQVHCPRIYLDNSIRDIMMQYYYCSRSRRGIEYHMATRAVKFIRDQAAAAVEKLQHDPPVRKERRATAASTTQAAVQNVRKLLGVDILGSTSVESSPEPLFHTLDNRDPMRGWSQGVSLRKGHFCLLLKPQLILRSEKEADAAEAVCVLAAVQGKLQTYNIMDDANADDPVSGKVMSRNFASLSGLQAFSPSDMNKSGLGVVPLEVLIDLRCGSNYFDRLVPQTDATFHYDKFNRLRLRNEATSALTQKSDVDDQLHNHLHSQNDLVRVHVPHFTVSANDRHFQSISNIVTNLLLFSNAAHKTRAERLEKLLFNYDFTNLGSAADVVAKFQARLRMAAETRKEAEKKLRTLGSDGQIEKFKIKAHMLLLGEELDYVFEAIKLAQDKAVGQAAQKSALLLHASSSEISWRMIDRQEQLLAKLAVRDIHFRWLNKQDSSTVNQLVFGDLQAFDGAADAEWTEILSKYDEPSNHPLVKRKLFCEAKWAVLPPVGGITIYQSFELMLHPMRLQLDIRVGRKILEYLWPARRKRANNRTITLALPEDDLGLPPSPSSPNGPHTPRTPRRPNPTRRMSADLPSPTSHDPNRLAVPDLRKTTSRSYSDLRKAAADSLQASKLARTRSTDMLVSPAMTAGTSRVSDDSRDRLPFRREADDATLMKTRSSQKTFVRVKVSSLHVLLSIMKEDSFLCRDARIQTRDLEYRNQTLSFEELVEQFIPSGRNWKGWVKMAFSQPLVPVLPVAREIISKTKWVNTKHHHDPHRRGTMVRAASSSSTSTNGIRQRAMSTFTSREKNREKNALYKGENLSSLGLVTAEPEPMPPVPPMETDDSATVRRPRNKLFKVFKRRRQSKTRDSIDSVDSTRTTSTKSSWSPDAENPPDTARPLVMHSSPDLAT